MTTRSITSIERFDARGQHLCKFIGTKKAFTKEKSSTPTGLVWDTNMAAVTSRENAICTELHKLKLDNNAINLILILVLFSKKVSVAPTGVQICFSPLRQYYNSIKS